MEERPSATEWQDSVPPESVPVLHETDDKSKPSYKIKLTCCLNLLGEIAKYLANLEVLLGDQDTFLFYSLFKSRGKVLECHIGCHIGMLHGVYVTTIRQ